MYSYYHTEYCQGIIDDSTCPPVSTDDTSSCVLATLQCENKNCSAVISGVSRFCEGFTNIIGANTVSQPIQCCYCNISVGVIPIRWWDCENVTTPTQSQTPSREFYNVPHNVIA